MGVRNLFNKPLHFEYSLALFALWKLLRLYALSKQLCLVAKELAGEKKVVTTLARKDDENYKKTLALLKPYLTSAAYHKTLEYAKDKLKLQFLFEVVHLVASLAFAFNKTALKFWHFAGKLHNHRCVYSHVMAYVAVRAGFSFLFRFPFRYGSRFCLSKKHGLKTKSKFAFFKQLLACYLSIVFLGTLFLSGLTFLSKFSKKHFHLNVVLFLVALAMVYVWLVPCHFKLFLKAHLLHDSELKKEVDLMAKKLGLSHKNVRVVPSDEASELVTLAWGLGKSRWLYLNESYVNLGKPSALALVAHGLGHFRHHHFFKFFLIKVVKVALFVFAFHHFKGHNNLFKSFGTHSVSALPLRLDTFAATAYVFVSFFYVLKNVYSDFVEFDADRYAVKHGHGDELVNFWTTVYREKKWFFNVDPLYGPLFNERPSLFERVYAVYDATVPAKPAT
ncbi:metalloprotease [Theileria orientalis strain Shintoku]|uniref:Metalloprotease n=1 Tax=Theileria orientalis strain Shintoku TaxID=869250 RepID=J4C8F5_THEOR|nr:metalloprotease [Theileria orientalis strain Shintoku]BAM40698.1 metalloprotease [Theileria orientalis strain Shintoku]|eukprot:XP_009690999.1 metalloprotease [Theileria orientalis strain Shintoku]